MPDADKFSRYIRESANELEKIIKKRGKSKAINKESKIKSTAFFAALKKYLKTTTSSLKKYNGIYEIEINIDSTRATWELNLTQEIPTLKKKKVTKPLVSMKIDDENLLALYKGKLLLEELMIQERIKLNGTQKNKTNFLQFLSEFLSR